MTRTVATIAPASWRPELKHRIVGAHTVWRILPSGAIEDRYGGLDVEQVRRFFTGHPHIGLARTVYESHRLAFDTAASTWSVPLATLVATACAESAGNPDAHRIEPDGRESFGLCQVLTGTAYTVGRAMGWPRRGEIEGDSEWLMPARSDADRAEWRAFLSDPSRSIWFCAAVHHFNAARWKTQHDPVLDYACYNAGGLYRGDANRFGLHATVAALESFVMFVNDFSEVV